MNHTAAPGDSEKGFFSRYSCSDFRTLWGDDDVLQGWRARGGKGRRYSDMAIRTALCLRSVFGLALRQTQGFLGSLKALMGLANRLNQSCLSDKD